MEVEAINLKEYYVKKTFPYVMMVITLIFYAFPFKGLHNTFNLIQVHGLPDYFYPIFIGLFSISFFIMIGSFFSKPSLSKKALIINESGIYFEK
jgi:hypothetical protein